MRTTLNIADDVLHAAKDRARREKRSLGDVISDLLRQALTRLPVGRDEERPEPFYGFHPLPRRGGVVTNELVEKIRDEENI
jgi:hypothetical protein